MVTVEELKKLSEQSVNDNAELVDLKTVHVDTTLDKAARIEDYISQIGNPYLFKVNGMTVKISFSGNRKLEDCIKEYLF